MDLNTVTEVKRAAPQNPGAGWREGDAYLAGGTWLFSAPQPELRRLIDLGDMPWPTLVVSESGLEIGATCTVRELFEFEPPAEWAAGPLIRECVHAFLAGHKIWNSMTVGGNICMSLPAGAMISLTAALDSTYTLWDTDGNTRVVAATEFVTGNNANVLAPGELLRRIDIPAASLARRYTLRRFSLTKLGRSSILVIATWDEVGVITLSITAATVHPVNLVFDSLPSEDDLIAALDAATAGDVWFDDPNGRPDHRRHMTYFFARQIREELQQKLS